MAQVSKRLRSSTLKRNNWKVSSSHIDTKMPETHDDRHIMEQYNRVSILLILLVCLIAVYNCNE